MKNQNIEIQYTKEYGDMSLCNLASINLVKYLEKDDKGRDRIARNIVRGLDNAITNGECPVPEGNISNELYRYIGVGVMNAANALALDKIVIDTQEAAEWFDRVMEDVCYRLYYQSMLLAKERGPFPEFENTRWAEGLTPVHLSLEHFPDTWQLTEFGRNFVKNGYLDKWTELGRLIKENGIRNAQVCAIAPTASSGKAINATESTEPVHALLYKEEGTQNVTTLAPNIRLNAAYYKPAFECNQKALLINAAVRQKYIDQAQSITMYLNDISSLKAFTELHMFAFKHGIKSLYYVKTPKPTDLDECVACAV